MTSNAVPIGVKKAAVLCILKSDAGLLLLRRSKEPHLGKYIPIGGHVEPFEAPREAAVREVREETGIVLPEVDFRGLMTETSPTKFNWINYVYSAEISFVPPIECNEGVLEWVLPADIGTIPTPTTDRFIYDFVTKQRPFMLDARYNESIELIRLTDELSGTILYP